MNSNRHHELTKDQLTAFVEYLRAEEREEATIRKYIYYTYTYDFFLWLNCMPVTKAAAVAWKESLQEEGRLAPAAINAKIASVNAFFKFAGREECKIKSLRLQRRVAADNNSITLVPIE